LTAAGQKGLNRSFPPLIKVIGIIPVFPVYFSEGLNLPLCRGKNQIGMFLWLFRFLPAVQEIFFAFSGNDQGNL
jgi:hypothetical protein